MGTRGFFGFAVNSDVKITYNHSDSYPDWLGCRVLDWAREADLDAARTAAANLRVVDDGTPVTDDDIAALAPYTDLGVGRRGDRPDWYQLLRKTQGDPAAVLAAGVIKDAGDFPADSLFCEWGYLVDFDVRQLEVYVGFQKSPHRRGRFAEAPLSEPTNGYHPVARIGMWPLDELPDVDAFVDTCEVRAEEPA